MKKQIADRQFHPIGIGTWGMGGTRLSDDAIFADYDHDQREIEAIRYSISQGQNHLDTAQLYGAGHTEEIVREAIRDIPRENLFIVSKVWKSHAYRSAVPKAVEGILSRLHIPYLDLIYIHGYFKAVPISEYIQGLNDVVDRGLATAIGVSNFTLNQLKEAEAISHHPIVAVQNHYNLIERTYVPQELLDYCREKHIAVVAYRPLERKKLTGETDIPELRAMAKRHNASVSQIALAWLLAQEGVIPIPKASSKEHIDENLQSLHVSLSPEDMKVLNELRV